MPVNPLAGLIGALIGLASCPTTVVVASQVIDLDLSFDKSRVDELVQFDGVGVVSGGGGGTRLLFDYEEPHRGNILDLLFKPSFGASAHVLKVEIGCDGDTTQGAEQSHMRTAEDNAPTAFDRNYEHWLLQEAQARSPHMQLSGLFWGVPSWVVNGSQTLFTPQVGSSLVGVLNITCTRVRKLDTAVHGQGAELTSYFVRCVRLL